MFPIAENRLTHAEYFRRVANYIKQTYKIEVDKSGKDLSRACFLPCDPPGLHQPEIRYQIMKKTFNPEEWGESQQTSAPKHTTPRPSSPSDSSDDIEIVTQRIEAAGVDITGDYASWRDLGFALSENGTVDDYFKDLGNQFFDFYNILKETGNVHFHLTPAQQDEFNGYFKVIHEEYPQFLGDEIIASVRRLGLITFRIAMILSTVRMMDDGDFGTERMCSEDDFQAAMIISKALLQHTARVFRELPRVATQKAVGSGQKTVRRQLFLDALPDEFDRQTFIDISSRLGMPLSTAERNIKKWTDEGLLIRQDLGHYKKVGK